VSALHSVEDTLIYKLVSEVDSVCNNAQEKASHYYWIEKNTECIAAAEGTMYIYKENGKIEKGNRPNWTVTEEEICYLSIILPQGEHEYYACWAWIHQN